MRLRVELWVRLKVVDLVAETAWITLTEKLDFAGRILGLVHYNYWRFAATGENGEAVIAELDRVVRIDSAFTNQNKHSYRLMASGAESGEAPSLVRGDLALERDYPLRIDPGEARIGGARSNVSGAAAGGLFAVDCLVRERHGDREASSALRLNARLRGVHVSEPTCGELWRVCLSAGSSEEAVGTVERMAVTRSRREGLLMNPHYQMFEVLAAMPLPSGARGAQGG